jgi:YHS domain-containing protein/positive regulator of sigma E activity
MVVRARNKVGAKIGDLVALDLGSGVLVKSALLVYLMPMVGLVCGALLGAMLHQSVGLDETLAAIVFGVGGLTVSFLITRVLSGRMGAGDSLTPIITTVLRSGLEEAVPRGVVDPICNMVVDPAQAPARCEYKGKMVYFCHPGCREAFQKNPERYL